MSKNKTKYKNYRVQWEIDIWAKTPREAAREAYKIQTDPDSTATFFTVADDKGKTTEINVADDGE